MSIKLTDEQIKEIYSRANQGIESVKVACERIRIPSSTVFTRGKKMGLSAPRSLPKLSDKQAIAAYQLVVEQKKQIKEVAKTFNVDTHTLVSAWKRVGLESPGHQRVSDEEIRRIYAAHMKGELQIGQAAKALGVARITLSNRARELGLFAPKIVHSCNHRFFSETTPLTAYWVGWLASDGNLQVCAGGGKKIKLKIHEQDVAVLEALKRDLAASQPIRTEQAVSIMRSLTISSCLMFGDLVAWGLHPKKSLTLLPPEFLTDELAWAWIAGYHAGDGWTSFIKENKFGVGFVGTFHVLSWIRKFINAMLGIPDAGCLREMGVTLHKNTWNLSYRGNQRPLSILRQMYHHAPYVLQRKYKPLLEREPHNEPEKVLL